MINLKNFCVIFSSLYVFAALSPMDVFAMEEQETNKIKTPKKTKQTKKSSRLNKNIKKRKEAPAEKDEASSKDDDFPLYYLKIVSQRGKIEDLYPVAIHHYMAKNYEIAKAYFENICGIGQHKTAASDLRIVVEACDKLREMYQEGLGVVKDKNKAYRFLLAMGHFIQKGRIASQVERATQAMNIGSTVEKKGEPLADREMLTLIETVTALNPSFVKHKLLKEVVEPLDGPLQMTVVSQDIPQSHQQININEWISPPIGITNSHTPQIEDNLNHLQTNTVIHPPSFGAPTPAKQKQSEGGDFRNFYEVSEKDIKIEANDSVWKNIFDPSSCESKNRAVFAPQEEFPTQPNINKNNTSDEVNDDVWKEFLN